MSIVPHASQPILAFSFEVSLRIMDESRRGWAAMSVRLESFEYLPRGANGWGSRLLRFGSVFTAVQGSNGTGKTPIMKGVVQGLGHEVELPPMYSDAVSWRKQQSRLMDGPSY